MATRNLNWSQEAIVREIYDYSEWNALVDTLDWEKYILWEATKGARTSRYMWVDGRWSYQFEGECPRVYIGYSTHHHEIWRFVPCEIGDEGKDKESQEPLPTGFQALKALKQRMGANNNKKLQARFGALDQTEENLWLIEALHAINRCVGPFVGNASLVSNQYYDKNVYKADISSAYPAQGLEKLPDLHTAQLFDYRIEPSEEWPIVFYLDSHHVAEYQRFDTRKEFTHDLYRNYRNPRGKKVHKTARKKEYQVDFLRCGYGEQCLACKYSKYGIPEFQEFYDMKESGDEYTRNLAKSVMNKSIGCLDFVACPEYKIIPCKIKYFGHIRAIICARHNKRMIEIYDEIQAQGSKVLQVQTDSIIWQGKPIASATSEKYLGCLHTEITDGRAFIHGCGAYWVEDNNQAIEKHQGIKGFPKFETLETFKEYFELNTTKLEFEVYEINPQTLKFEWKNY